MQLRLPSLSIKGSPFQLPARRGLHGIHNPHNIVLQLLLRAAESRRGRHSVESNVHDTLALAARAVSLALHLGRLALLLRPKGDTQLEGDIDTVTRGCRWRCGCACPTGLCATARGVESPPLLLVDTITLFRVQGCEEGSKCGEYQAQTGIHWQARLCF
jgi:hypothetical protein